MAALRFHHRRVERGMLGIWILVLTRLPLFNCRVVAIFLFLKLLKQGVGTGYGCFSVCARLYAV